MIKIGPYVYQNEEELIQSFRDILKPKYNSTNKSNKFSDYTNEDFAEYNWIMPWLKENNYIIEEFPNVIERQLDLKAFGYDSIRNYHYKNIGDSTGTVTWQARRSIIDSLNIKSTTDSPLFEMDKSINEIIKEISTGKGEFHIKETEEQLAVLNNTLEYLLKKDKKYSTVDTKYFHGFLDNSDIIKFRKDTQIFRHSTEMSILERKSWSNEKKKFYLRLGIILVTNVYENDFSINFDF